ncbi:MAG TPA: hypothetical protein PK325_15860 [Cyclobacteriaceae bacterium]|nr:hypothetical protein [Cyclobacteriaceae bacterium]HMV10070.1 hypothetical protein [Cyclobacteriaceae bacterium]HMV90914.1 hypothetical protein [Cyclobacteriaceae bacterium]HMW99841.1 hypothetical protein [Cyclobacteriaceae bacterium]HMX49296.1 hypothetical protein [Cyclobacteriaceae bacterium]
MTNTSLTYELRLIAFIDILGFKDIVKQSEADTSKIELIYSVLSYLKDWEKTEKWDLKFIEIEESAQYKGVSNFDIRGKTNTTSFSDSIVVSLKVDNNVNEMASTLIVNLAYIGTVLLEKGILFRGGLTIGNIIHIDNGTVFGQGLIDAFMLETRSAKFPRIVLSDKLLSQLNYPITTKRHRYPYHQYLDRFEDGCVGFHQLIYYQVIENWTEMTPELLTESLRKVRKVIVDGLDSSFEKPEVFEKYYWLKEQYNKLIILSDFDFDTKKEENIKQKIRGLNEGIAGQNIHYSYTDNFYESRNKKKKE